MGKRLMKKLGFDKFRIIRRGGFFILQGHINPRIDVGKGKLKNKKIPGGQVGDLVKKADGTIEGVIVGTRGSRGGAKGAASKFVDKLRKASPEERLKQFQDLVSKGEGELADKARRAIINGGEGTAELRKGIDGIHPEFFQAHHILSLIHI